MTVSCGKETCGNFWNDRIVFLVLANNTSAHVKGGIFHDTSSLFLGRRGRRFLALALAACMLCAALPQVLAANPEVDAGAVYCFQSAEFHTGASDDLTGICITGVPQSALGTVRLGSRIICPGDILTAGQLDTMTFHPTAAGGQEAQLTYLPIYGNRVEQEPS